MVSCSSWAIAARCFQRFAAVTTASTEASAATRATTALIVSGAPAVTGPRAASRRAGAGDREPSNPHAASYLNRVSDLLYVLARQAAGDEDEPPSHVD